MKKLKILKIGISLILAAQLGGMMIFLAVPQVALADSSYYWTPGTVPAGESPCPSGQTIADPSKCGISVFQQQQNPGTCCHRSSTIAPTNYASLPTTQKTYNYTPSPAKNSVLDRISKSLQFTPQVPIPGFLSTEATSIAVGAYNSSGVMSSDLLAKYIQALYKYGLAIGGILAAIVLMGGGVLWLISAGNDSKVTQAKELISGSVIGLIILFGSWLLLDTINPNLTKLQTIRTVVIQPSILGCCEYKDTNGKQKAEMLGSVSCKINKGDFFESNNNQANNNINYGTRTIYYVPDYSTGNCVATGCCITSYPGNPLSRCITTTNTSCKKLKKGRVNSTFYSSTCQLVPEFIAAGGPYSSYSCGKTVDDRCATAKDGTTCFYGSDITGDYKYCYNHSCWIGYGKLGEPCGNNGGSTCAKSDSAKTRDLGGRSCLGSLKCYKK